MVVDPTAGDRAVPLLEELHARVEAGYPRPQLVRDEWTDLCGEWQFAYDDEDRGIDDGWWRPERAAFDRLVSVPFPPESERSGIGDGAPHPVVWYRRLVRLPPRRAGERLLLHFGAVDYAAQVWVDGQPVGSHRGGHTPFSCDLSSCGEDETLVVVRAEDAIDDPSQPRGKQDWRVAPHRIWYGRTTGIWQPVWLEVVPRQRVSSVALSVDLACRRVLAEVALDRGREDRWLRIRLFLGDELLAEQTQRVLAPLVRMAVHVPALENAWDSERLEWSPEHPTLVGVELSLLGSTGSVEDRVLSYLGLRTIKTAERHVLLNDRPQYLRMVLAQGYWPESHLAAPSRDALREEVELVRSLGFNGVRLHQKIEDPLFLYWADRLGLLVWEEMPSSPGSALAGAEQMLSEWLEVLRRDRSHPSVIAWVPFNESWGVQSMSEREGHRKLVGALAELTRALDPTRPVVSNDGWEHVDSDIWGVHDYATSGAVLRQRYGSQEALHHTLTDRWPAVHRVVLQEAPDKGQPVVLSEFGGVALPPQAEEGWHGYNTVLDAGELSAQLRELFQAVQASDELAGFCYTQLADTEQESNGLLWADRKPKVPLEELRAIISGTSGTSDEGHD